MPKQIAIQKEQPVAVFNSRVTNRKEEKEPTQKSEKKKIRSVQYVLLFNKVITKTESSLMIIKHIQIPLTGI